MQIVFAASECVPFAKTGGLADVVGALPRELVKLGHEVTVYLPFYARCGRTLTASRSMRSGRSRFPFGPTTALRASWTAASATACSTTLWIARNSLTAQSFTARGGATTPTTPSASASIAARCLRRAKLLGVPEVFHVHDWQAALIPVYLRTVYASDPALRSAAAVLTIHNAAYQGAFPPKTTERLLFPWEIFTMDKLEQFDHFNFLKGGMVFSDMLTTVSRKYAEEIQTPEFGEELDGVLRGRAADLRGILNGVDYAQWDPATDGNLAAHYTPEDLAGKRSAAPICCTPSAWKTWRKRRRSSASSRGLPRRRASTLWSRLPGSSPSAMWPWWRLAPASRYYEKFFRDWAFWHKANVAVQIRYDDALAHKIEAGSDMFLMPSRYEPCGLNQIYSLKYGTVPVVRATGGLDDTIEEWNAEKGTGTGFKFAGFDPKDLLAAIDRALAAFSDKEGWTRLMRNGMARNYSWSRPAKEYVKVYEEAARRRA